MTSEVMKPGWYRHVHAEGHTAPALALRAAGGVK